MMSINRVFFRYLNTAFLMIISTAGLFSLPAAANATPSHPFSIAFFYAANPPLDELQAFDVVVVDPDATGVSPVQYRTPHSELFAYTSVGEADPNRSFFKKIDPAWLLADNKAWKSKVVDLANPDWRAFFLDQIIEPLWKAGYRGFFLDTLDSYQLVTDKERLPALQEGLVQIIRALKKRHPEARLILNRGFEVLPQVKDAVFAVAAESLFRNFDPASGQYSQVGEQDRQWLLARFAEVRKAGLPVIAIEYVAPKDRDQARTTAKMVMSVGAIPWVTDKDISSLGVGAVEVLPRKILGLYDSAEAPDQIYTALHRLTVMPFNYLGYTVHLHDMRKPLPGGILIGRYAGIVIWPNADTSGQQQGLQTWIRQQIQNGSKIVFLDRFGLPPREAAAELGLNYRATATAPSRLSILSHDPLMGFELQIMPRTDNFWPIRAESGQALLTIGVDRTPLSDPVALTRWGGYALLPFVAVQALTDNYRWVLDPFTFFPRALQLAVQPAPDVTTENGVRLLFSHIDADGLESRVERPGGPLGITELRERILKKYRLPTTFSVITSALGDRGYNNRSAKGLQQEAREIFALPWVEAASHTFSHPFYWQNTDVAKRNYKTQYLDLPGYRFNLDQEIVGSSRFIEQHLLPPDKKVKLLHWSGDCTPGTDALSISYRAGLGNINGGATIITKSNNSVTLVAPLGVGKGDYFQVFAANQNENVYTGDWTGPFYGYRRVLETFRLTDSPRRLKPINIYYHVYSVTKEASRKALEDVHAWALAQEPHVIYTSDYVDKVLDFNRTVIARSGESWLIRNHGHLRQLRLPITAGFPDLAASRGILGYADHNDQRYIHLAPGGEALLKLSDTPPPQILLSTGSARIDHVEQTGRGKGMKLTATAIFDGRLRFGNAAGCHIRLSGAKSTARPEGTDLVVTLQPGNHDLELVCK